MNRRLLGIQRPKVGEFALDGSPQKRGEFLGHLVPLAITLFGSTHAVITPPLLVRMY
jgi:hypothetical protein